MKKNYDQLQCSVGQQTPSAKSLIPVPLFSLQDNRELSSLLFSDLCLTGLSLENCQVRCLCMFVVQTVAISKQKVSLDSDQSR